MKHFVFASALLWYFVLGGPHVGPNVGVIRIYEPDEATCDEIATNIQTFNPTYSVGSCKEYVLPTQVGPQAH